MRLIWNIDAWTAGEPSAASTEKIRREIDAAVDQVADKLRHELGGTAVQFSVRVERSVETEHGTNR